MEALQDTIRDRKEEWNRTIKTVTRSAKLTISKDQQLPVEVHKEEETSTKSSMSMKGKVVLEVLEDQEGTRGNFQELTLTLKLTEQILKILISHKHSSTMIKMSVTSKFS